MRAHEVRQDPGSSRLATSNTKSRNMHISPQPERRAESGERSKAEWSNNLRGSRVTNKSSVARGRVTNSGMSQARRQRQEQEEEEELQQRAQLVQQERQQRLDLRRQNIETLHTQHSANSPPRNYGNLQLSFDDDEDEAPSVFKAKTLTAEAGNDEELVIKHLMLELQLKDVEIQQRDRLLEQHGLSSPQGSASSNEATHITAGKTTNISVHQPRPQIQIAADFPLQQQNVQQATVGRTAPAYELKISPCSSPRNG